MDQYDISEYYPIEVGNSWTYIDSKKEILLQTCSEIIANDDSTIEKFVTSEGREIFVKGKEGLNAFRIKMKGVELNYNPPLSMSSQKPFMGEQHPCDSKVWMSIQGVKINFGRISGTTILRGEEDITVPAGNFKKCLKFETTVSQRILFFSVKNKLVVWFARETGGIRYDFTTTFAGMKFSSQRMLLKAKLGIRNLPSSQ